jgi:mono/diheme cytochrome c family protein
MPQFSFLSYDETTKLIAYVQSLGQKSADARTNVQKTDKANVVASLQGKSGSANVPNDANYATAHLDYLKSLVPPSWVNTKSAMPPTQRSLLHGKQIYITNCIGCHGLTGQGDGPAAAFLEPKPFNFTNANVQMQHSEGQYYHFLLFGLPGTAMPAWGDYLSVQDIWDVINFLRTIPNGGLTVPDEQLNSNMVVRGGAAGPAPAPFDQNAEGYQYGQNLNVPTPTAGPPPTNSGGASQSPIANTPTPSK